MVVTGERTAPRPGARATSTSTNNEPAPLVEKTEAEEEEDNFHPGLRLWIIIIGLGVTTLLCALENTVVTVAAPVILTDLNLGGNYIWIIDAFFICRFVFNAHQSLQRFAKY